MTGSPFGIVPTEIFDLGLKSSTIAVFCALTTFANKQRIAHPSRKTLGKMVGISERQVREHLRILEDIGVVTTVSRFDNSGRQSSNEYRLDLLISSRRGEADNTLGGEAGFMGEGEADNTQTVPLRTVPKEQIESSGGELTLLPSQPDILETAVAEWNVTAEQTGMPRCQALNESRKRSLRARLKECGGLDGWRALMRHIPNEEWMFDGSRNGWKANIDYVLAASKFPGLMEKICVPDAKPAKLDFDPEAVKAEVRAELAGEPVRVVQ